MHFKVYYEVRKIINVEAKNSKEAEDQVTKMLDNDTKVTSYEVIHAQEVLKP